MSKENMTSISIRISQEEKKKLQDIANELDLSISYLIRKAIKDHIIKN